eukprot:3713895-Pyramimonas_sp.AAC.1
MLAGPKVGEQWEPVRNWTQGEKRGRVSGVWSAPLHRRTRKTKRKQAEQNLRFDNLILIFSSRNGHVASVNDWGENQILRWLNGILSA